MIIQTKKIYKCEHCKKLYQRRHACEKHEKHCWQNPENDRACLNCVHLRKERVTIEEGHPDHPYEVNFDAFYCGIIASFVYTPKTEVKGNAFDEELLGEANIPMLKECEHQNICESFPNLPITI